jgi:S1-C subfamily serine protease
MLEEAIYTAPAHPFWGGTALIGPAGDLLGIGSLQIQAVSADESRPLPHRQRQSDDANMIVPIDLLKPILDDLATIGRPNRPARPWLGLYATEIGSSVALLGVSGSGPAHDAGLREGDILLAVAGTPVSSLAELFRRIWALGDAGVAVPLTVTREGRTFEASIRSTDRRKLLKGPVLH